ncbi:helix-turn-helix domain-containing protein [Aeoliella mucimassa]|uniref:Helix-turn-helix domain protein n=1 Tax=Aeoliella mucimassa TaxID=2527972 RepID=A0A518APT7_9BACT|nr:helix-turn-helix domain-containing protein [Aeoliella mucimassa]QDU56734.1 Helix-turn-helix domain protein [Aeoliella mucimassa]
MNSPACLSNPYQIGRELAPPTLLSPKQASEALSISPRKLWTMTASGEITCVRLGRSVRYSVAELHRLVSASSEGGAKCAT